MVNLLEQLASRYVSVLLADTRGDILDMVSYEGSDRSRDEAWPKTLSPTTPAAAAEAAQQYPASDKKKPAVFGVATPINAAAGGLLGLLDRSHEPTWGMNHLCAMLQLTAETIERRVVEHDHRGFLLLRFHTRAELLDGPCDAIALFDRDSRLIGYNKLAANLLSLSPNSLNAPCQTCFDTQWPGLVGSAALAKTSPIKLHARNGMSVLARASLR